MSFSPASYLFSLYLEDILKIGSNYRFKQAERYGRGRERGREGGREGGREDHNIHTIGFRLRPASYTIDDDKIEISPVKTSISIS